MALLACGEEAARPDGAAPRVVDARELERTTMIRDADRRTISEAIRAAFESADPVARRTATLATTRAHQLDAIPLLRRGLRDTDAEVRGAASLGMGAFEDEAPEGLARELAAAFAAEEDPAIRAQMIRDLGRLRSQDAMPAVEGALRASSGTERAGACRALAEYGLQGQNVPPSARSRAAALLAQEQPVEVRLACAFALARLPAPADAESGSGEVVALGLAAADADPDVRMHTHRALGIQPGAALETLVQTTRDSEWRAAVTAYRALGAACARRDGGPAIYAQRLEAAHRAAVRRGHIVSGGPLHVLLTALEAAAPMARTEPIHTLAERIHRELGRGRPTRERGLAHCAAAELVDRGRGWPSRIDACGLDQVSPAERAARSAAIIAGIEGAERERSTLLRRLFRDATPPVQEAVLQAAPSIWHPSITDLVLRALRSRDAGVLSTASEALAAIARRTPSETRVPPPVSAERAIASLRTARRNIDDGELETLVTWLDAVEATDARPLATLVRALALHANYAVRTRARKVLTQWEMEMPEGRVAPPDNVVELTEILPADARPRVRLTTDRGAIVIELRPDAAPTTVARFSNLVRAHFYDGLTFHRVVPAFVVQGGDPRGDGYGGPDWAQRCEDNRLPYTRGTVGMALAGRDTGGSQFFITHAAQPHLEARYTAFGQVVEGMDVVDALQVGDRIRSAVEVSQ